MPRRAQLRRPAALPWRAALATAAPLLALACNWDRPSGPRVTSGPPRASIGFVGSAFYALGGAGAAYLSVGDTATLRASAYSPPWPDTLVYDSYRSDTEARRFRWTSSDTAVATIGPTGFVTARARADPLHGERLVHARLQGRRMGRHDRVAARAARLQRARDVRDRARRLPRARDGLACRRRRGAGRRAPRARLLLDLPDGLRR